MAPFLFFIFSQQFLDLKKMIKYFSFYYLLNLLYFLRDMLGVKNLGPQTFSSPCGFLGWCGGIFVHQELF